MKPSLQPGDLVKLGSGNAARLFLTREMWEHPPWHIVDIVHKGEVGIVLATFDVGDRDINLYPTHLLLFGDKLGWRDALPFKALR